MKLFTFTRTGALALAATLALTAPHQAAASEDIDAAAVAAIRQAAMEAGDATAGEKVFKKCKACHQVGEGAKKRVGPVLTNVVGSPMGASEGFKYSKGMLAKNEEGGIWDVESLQAFLTKPRDFVTKTKMTFPGLKKEEDRNNIIAFLASVADE